MIEEAKAARREYMKNYKKNNRERLNFLAREWNKNNPEKAKAIRDRYWAKRASNSNHE